MPRDRTRIVETERRIDAQVAGGGAGAFPGPPRQSISKEKLLEVRLGANVDKTLVDQLIAFVVEAAEARTAIGLSGLVVGLSGGLDSVVCAELCKRACDGARPLAAVTVVFGARSEEGRLDGIRAAACALDVAHTVVDGSSVREALGAAWPENGPWSPINLDTRAIQSLVFQIADSRASMVVATTDLSEALLGRFTEAFYGQIAPLAGLYKTEVAQLARVLGVADAVVDTRPGCPDHWYDDEVLGCGYDVLDPLLNLLGEGHSPKDIAAKYRISDVAWLESLARRIELHSLRTATLVFRPDRTKP